MGRRDAAGLDEHTVSQTDSTREHLIETYRKKAKHYDITSRLYPAPGCLAQAPTIVRAPRSQDKGVRHASTDSAARAKLGEGGSVDAGAFVSVVGVLQDSDLGDALTGHGDLELHGPYWRLATAPVIVRDAGARRSGSGERGYQHQNDGCDGQDAVGDDDRHREVPLWRNTTFPRQ